MLAIELTDADLHNDAKIRRYLSGRLQYNDEGYITWNGECEQVLLRLRAAGRSFADLQSIFNEKTCEHLAGRVGKVLCIGLEPANAPQHQGRFWQKTDEASLKEMWNSQPRPSYAQMGARLQRTPWSVYCKLSKMGFVNMYKTPELLSDRSIQWAREELENQRAILSQGSLSPQRGVGGASQRRQREDENGSQYQQHQQQQQQQQQQSLSQQTDPRRTQRAQDLQTHHNAISQDSQQQRLLQGGAQQRCVYVNEQDEEHHNLMKQFFPENYLQVEDEGFFGVQREHDSQQLFRPQPERSSGSASSGGSQGPSDVRAARAQWLARRAGGAAAAAATASSAELMGMSSSMASQSNRLERPSNITPQMQMLPSSTASSNNSSLRTNSMNRQSQQQQQQQQLNYSSDDDDVQDNNNAFLRAAQPPQPGNPGPRTADDDPVGKVTALGFTDVDSIQRALMMCDGNAQRAINLLLDNDGIV